MIKMLYGSDLAGNNIGIKLDKKIYIDAMEISSANKNNSIMVLESIRIPNKEAAMRANEKIMGILRLCNTYHQGALLFDKYITSWILYPISS